MCECVSRVVGTGPGLLRECEKPVDIPSECSSLSKCPISMPGSAVVVMSIGIVSGEGSRGMRGSERAVCMPGLGLVVIVLSMDADSVLRIVLGCSLAVDDLVLRIISVVAASGGEDGGWDALLWDAATAMFNPLSGATRLAFDTVSLRGMRGCNEVSADDPIEEVTSQLKMILNEPLHGKTYPLPWAVPTHHYSTTSVQFLNDSLQLYRVDSESLE